MDRECVGVTLIWRHFRRRAVGGCQPGKSSSVVSIATRERARAEVVLDPRIGCVALQGRWWPRIRGRRSLHSIAHHGGRGCARIVLFGARVQQPEPGATRPRRPPARPPAPRETPTACPIPAPRGGHTARMGSTPGSVIQNFKFQGYPNADMSKGLQTDLPRRLLRSLRQAPQDAAPHGRRRVVRPVRRGDGRARGRQGAARVGARHRHPGARRRTDRRRTRNDDGSRPLDRKARVELHRDARPRASRIWEASSTRRASPGTATSIRGPWRSSATSTGWPGDLNSDLQPGLAALPAVPSYPDPCRVRRPMMRARMRRLSLGARRRGARAGMRRRDARCADACAERSSAAGTDRARLHRERRRRQDVPPERSPGQERRPARFLVDVLRAVQGGVPASAGPLRRRQEQGPARRRRRDGRPRDDRRRATRS